MESHLFVCKVACRLHCQKNVLWLSLLFRETLFIFAAIELSTFCVHSVSSNYTWSKRYLSFNTISAPNGVVTCIKSCFHPVLLHRSLLLLHCHWCSDLRLWFFRHFTKNKLFWKWVILQVPSLRTGFFSFPRNYRLFHIIAAICQMLQDANLRNLKPWIFKNVFPLHIAWIP